MIKDMTDLEQAIMGIIPQSTHTTEALQKIKELFTQTAGKIEKQSTPREQTMYAWTQRVNKAAQNKEETKHRVIKDPVQETRQITTQVQTWIINQEVAHHMQKMQKPNRIYNIAFID